VHGLCNAISLLARNLDGGFLSDENTVSSMERHFSPSFVPLSFMLQLLFLLGAVILFNSVFLDLDVGNAYKSLERRRTKSLDYRLRARAERLVVESLGEDILKAQPEHVAHPGNPSSSLQVAHKKASIIIKLKEAHGKGRGQLARSVEQDTEAGANYGASDNLLRERPTVSGSQSEEPITAEATGAAAPFDESLLDDDGSGDMEAGPGWRSWNLSGNGSAGGEAEPFLTENAAMGSSEEPPTTQPSRRRAKRRRPRLESTDDSGPLEAEGRRYSLPIMGSTNRTDKIGFLFLTRGQMPFERVWRKFFEQDSLGRHSIFVHAPATHSFPAKSMWRGRKIHSHDAVDVMWGEPSMVEAEKILLQYALKDHGIAKFALVSESDVPVQSFECTHKILTESKRSFVQSTVTHDRMPSKLKMYISQKYWRKGSQWFVLNRDHAELVVEDREHWVWFKRYCTIFSLQPCVADEHYIPTLLALRRAESTSELYRHSMTWAQWLTGKPSPEVLGKNSPVRTKIHEIRRCHYSNAHHTKKVFYPIGIKVPKGWTQRSSSLLCAIFTSRCDRAVCARLP